MNAFLQEAISGMSLIQIFHREDRMFEKFDKINFNHYKATQKSVLAYSIFYPVVEFIEWLAIALLVWYGGNRAVAGFVSFGSLIAFINLHPKIF